jgi:hypothetical protein
MTPPIQTAQQRQRVVDASDFSATDNTPVAQLFIFRGVTFVGQDCFSQERISIGSGAQADLVLEGDGIADVQAYVYLKDGQIIISDRTAKGVRVNGTIQKTAMLRPLDLVDIGPYTLKIKALSGEAAASARSQPKPQKRAQCPADPARGETPSAPIASATPNIQTGAAPIESAAATADDDRSEDPDAAFADFFQFYADPATVNYDIVFYGQMKPSAEPERVKAGLQQLFRAAPQQIEGLFRQPRVVIKKNLDYRKAQQLKTVFEKTGAQCHLEPVDDPVLRVDDFDPSILEPSAPESASTIPEPPRSSDESAEAAPLPRPLQVADLTGQEDTTSSEERAGAPGATVTPHTGPSPEIRPTVGPSEEPLLLPAEEEEVIQRSEATTAVADGVVESPKAPAADTLPQNPFATVGIYDDDEEEDEDPEADFQLQDKLTGDDGAPKATGDAQLQVIKLRNDQVLDICYLRKRQRYTIDWKGRKFCLAENRRNAPALFYFGDHLSGRIESSGEGVISTRRLMRDMKPWRKRKNLFRREMPADGCVLLHDGDFEYRLSVCDVAPPADVKLPPKEKRHPYKHAATSLVFHLVFIAFLGLVPSFNADDGETESHFVQLDQDQLAELEKIIQPKPKPKKPTPPPPKKVAPPPKPVVKKETPVTKVKPKRVAGKKKRKVAKAASASRHPKAGGGFGKGNVVNRDVNQAGLLSMLGDSVGFQPQAAVAAVTNLDAVTAPGGVAKANFKVGGIVGKLGTDKISVPTGGIVATKGTKQVLRSIGASGPGKVAALEKGKIGQRQVAGTVTASLTKSVLIQGGGGMSRQAVKRVIDQHLDEVTYCYETALISNPSIMGKMIFEWKILMNGEVGEVRIKSSTVNSHEIHACIKAAIKTWQFPKPKGSTVVVSYPFIFDVVGF